MFGFFGLRNRTPQPVQSFQGIQPQAGAAMQHPSNYVGSHQFNPAQSVPTGPQGMHNFAPQGQQWANQQAQIAQQKALADALRKQQEEAAAAQAAQEAANQQTDNGYGFYSG